MGIMKYIIMCGGTYLLWEKPRHLVEIGGVPVVARTIELLRENGIDDIAISSDNDIFGQFGIPVLKHANSYRANGHQDVTGHWCDAFYPMDEPACYLFGDVVFSPEAIKTIVETETDSIAFFASAPPFAKEYPKMWAEPFAVKVVDQGLLKESIRRVKQYEEEGLFRRKPIMWELWQVITGYELNCIDYSSYNVINDYTCDIDSAEDAKMFEHLVK